MPDPAGGLLASRLTKLASAKASARALQVQEGLSAAAPGCLDQLLVLITKSASDAQAWGNWGNSKSCGSSCCKMMDAGAGLPRSHSIRMVTLDSPCMARGIVRKSDALHFPQVGMNSKHGRPTAH